MRTAPDAGTWRARRYAWQAAAGLLLSSAMALAACNTGPATPNCQVNGVTVAANPTSITAGAISNLSATLNANASCNTALTWTATPAGGALTPSGATATFTSATPGAYTIRATSVADNTKNGEATVTVTAPAVTCGQPNGTTVTHNANIAASETWLGDGVTHLVPTSISITGTAVVTVDPCAIVALGPGVTITVRDNARLVAAGTGANRFVLFRRNNASQAWGSLRAFHPTSLIDLTWTRLEGGGAYGSLNNPTLIGYGIGYGSPPSQVLRTVNVTIQGSMGIGVFLDANGGFTNDSQQLTITGAGDRPVHTNMMALGSLPTGTYTGNANDEILITGPGANIFMDMTVDDPGVPIRIPFSNMYVGPVAPATAPVTLTLAPGVIFRFPRIGGGQPGARMTFGTNGNAPNNLVGVLNAVGTAAKPIVFTSGEATPAPGDWIGIWLNTANGSRLDYVEISYAGAPTGIQSNNCRPLNTADYAALFVGSFSAQYVPTSTTLTNSKIIHSAGFAIDAMWLAPTLNEPDLTPGNTFQNNARCRQTYNGLLPPGTCPLSGGCTAN